ncbi:cytotoxic translational repressor of toxin-antitoxin stability system [Leptolyngbya sp. 'hensonii']|uniref:cytotoxic translational repressor of toxin-antitoxin stability system n=1 Tax=Leptolyngbya sp. 'hensonii' TaxID=1922337 RepID=UPI00094FCE99|nr:cytotoxic translational repressor of toxin-antitoxin stability system [Leptolyngbya sp. 'hensonii']OLP19013.1 cytotoxic translational repressor of toxin-antitoxin stability system [Leptolyngbya sp. 'hensonii']
MKLEVRYERSFLQDLKDLEPAAYQRIRQFVFDDFLTLGQLRDLPELHQIGASAIFYRFTLDNYLVGIEITGEIIKFLRILPIPDI